MYVIYCSRSRRPFFPRFTHHHTDLPLFGLLLFYFAASCSHDVVLRVRQAVHDDGQDVRSGPGRSGTADRIPADHAAGSPKQRAHTADEGAFVGWRAGKDCRRVPVHDPRTGQCREARLQADMTTKITTICSGYPLWPTFPRFHFSSFHPRPHISSSTVSPPHRPLSSLLASCIVSVRTTS